MKNSLIKTYFNNGKRKAIFILIFFSNVIVSRAQNPVIQTVYTADPAPMVHNDTLFLYTGHDEDNTTEKGFIMKDYLLFSTTDMVNWTHHGPVFTTESLGWAAPLNANAAQVVFRNNRFYYYISPWSALADGGDCIAVGISDNPYGPFKDALGKPLIEPGQTRYGRHLWEDIDPTVLIDDDGQAYMYWGNNSLYCVKLNEDMISYSGDIITYDIKDKAAFGPDYEEAPWLIKRNGIYYMFYAAHVPEAIYYSTAKSPLGPWKYGGVIMKALAQGSTGNHPGVVQYKGQWYLFYFNQDLPGGHDKKRAVNVIPFDFNPDGSISELPHSKEGIIKAADFLDPYRRIEAETIAWEEGVETASNDETGVYVTEISNDEYIKIRSVDFGKGARKFEAGVATSSGEGNIELRLGSKTGQLVGSCKVKGTGGDLKWETITCSTERVRGVHDLYFVFKGSDAGLFNFDWWRFLKK